MPLVSVGQQMAAAKAGVYAVGYFESWSLDSLMGVIDAAQQTRSPVIIGFNGEFLSRRPGAKVEELPIYAAMGLAAAARATVPCALIFNECSDDSWTEQAIHAGFNLVMPADPDAELSDYTKRVTRLTALAHARNVAVEAEIDELPTGDSAGAGASDPEVAAAFVAATGVDLLAVSIGNEHIKLSGRAPLDLGHLESIRRRVDIPLVLHGGTGIEDSSLRGAVELGIRKVNYGTYLKQRYLKVMSDALAVEANDPHALLGGGGDMDMMELGRATIREGVLERIEVLGCCGRA